MRGDLPMLVFFFSERSGPSRRMESLLAHVARKERGRLRVKHVNVDEHPRLVRKFGVEQVPTLVFVKSKVAVDRIDGRASMPQIERLLERQLPLDTSPSLRFAHARGAPAARDW
jgi:thioredoxin-like negative regulator of GroEL